MRPPLPTAHVFADESGHSGANYVDRGQPLFATAAVVVPDGHLDSVNRVLLDFRNSHTPSRGRAQELKFGTLVKRGANRDAVARLLLDIMALGCEPIVDVWEKRFGIATRIVDAFCDPDYNPLALAGLHPGDQRRVQVAYFLDRVLPDDALHAFAKAFRKADAEGLREARNRVVRLARLGGQDGLATLIDACDVDELAADCSTENRHHRSLNFPSFLAILGMVDRAMERIDQEGPFIFDEQEEFRKPFEEAHEMLEPANVVDLVSATTSFRMGFARITEYRMASSSDTPGLQAADALAAVVRSGLCSLEELDPGSDTSTLLRSVFGMPEHAGGGPRRFGVTARLSSGEGLLRSFGHAMLAMPA